MTEETNVKLQWITPQAQQMIVETARVSSDPAMATQPDDRLLAFLIRKGHWSPFEMANICIEVHTTRDIGRQMLRHWTMRPQEFSQRYQDARILGEPVFREARMQHPTNRQASIPCDDAELAAWWLETQQTHWADTEYRYGEALARGISKEVARVLLPEGNTPTRMFFNANFRSVIHFCQTRTEANGAQKEVVQIAKQTLILLREHAPIITKVLAQQEAAT